MKQEYKFRAWLKNEKKMVDVCDISFEEKLIAYAKEYRDGKCLPLYFHVCKTFDEIELMLGLEIYDETIFIGDVVRIYGGECMFGYYEVDKIITIKNLEKLVTLFNMDYGIDVLGNIYENPELLEKNKNA